MIIQHALRYRKRRLRSHVVDVFPKLIPINIQLHSVIGDSAAASRRVGEDEGERDVVADRTADKGGGHIKLEARGEEADAGAVNTVGGLTSDPVCKG